MITAAVAAAIGLSACGSEGISVPKDSTDYRGAVLFSQRCAGCHTLSPAGTQGSANRNVRVQGPNLDQRKEKLSDVLFAIRNGGFSGGIMPAEHRDRPRGEPGRGLRLQVRGPANAR